MTDFPSLRVSDYGEVLAHLAIQPAETGVSISAVRGEVERLVGAVSESIEWALGESDLLLQVGVKDFRLVRDLQLRLSRLGVLGSTWLFSVPYRSELIQDILAPQLPHFVAYLRVNRALYRTFGVLAEQYAVARLQELASSFPGVRTSVHLCLGAPDLALVGRFSSSSEQFLPFIAAIRSLWLPSSEVEIFSATLSMASFVWPDHELIEDFKENIDLQPALVVFCKVSASFLRKVERAGGNLAVLLDSPRVQQFYLIDGRYDLALILDSEGMGSQELSDILTKVQVLGSQKTETHVLASGADSIWGNLAKATSTSLPPLEAQVLRFCDCQARAQFLVLDEKFYADLPQGLRTDVESLLSLFRSSLYEPASCCDTERSLRACHNGLMIVLSLLGLCHAKLRTARSEKRQRFLSGYIVLYRQILVEWCIHSERVLRERSVDSMSNPFGERKTIPEARGSLQKLLFLADNLVYEFYCGIDESVRRLAARPGSLFATVYEPIGTIVSQRHTGIIRIPSRYAFSLHLVVPQLWHEVGQFIFQNRYGHPFSVLSNKVADGLDESQKKILLTEAADLYADLIVLHYGFRDDLGSFSVYLTSLVLDSFLYEQYPKAIQKEKLEFLVRRLFHAAHFHSLRKILWGSAGVGGDVLGALREASNNFIANHDNVFDAAEEVWRIQEEERYRGQTILLRPRQSGVDGIAGNILGDLQNGIYARVTPFMTDLLLDLRNCEPLEVHPETAIRWAQIREGYVVDLGGVRSNDLYLELYKRDTRRLLDTPYGLSSEPDFKAMAALGRSCTVSLYTAL